MSIAPSAVMPISFASAAHTASTHAAPTSVQWRTCTRRPAALTDMAASSESAAGRYARRAASDSAAHSVSAHPTTPATASTWTGCSANASDARHAGACTCARRAHVRPRGRVTKRVP
eukprot:359653-Chlamydomonas_euryale.AAC.2